MKAMNLDELVAIDVHTHAEVSVRLAPEESEKEWLEARGKYFKYQPVHPTIPQMAAYYRERKMAFVVFTVDSEKEMGTLCAMMATNTRNPSTRLLDAAPRAKPSTMVWSDRPTKAASPVVCAAQQAVPRPGAPSEQPLAIASVGEGGRGGAPMKR